MRVIALVRRVGLALAEIEQAADPPPAAKQGLRGDPARRLTVDAVEVRTFGGRSGTATALASQPCFHRGRCIEVVRESGGDASGGRGQRAARLWRGMIARIARMTSDAAPIRNAYRATLLTVPGCFALL